MVSSPHEALHRIFRVDPGLFARLLPRVGIDFPEHTAIEPLDTDLTEIRPLERRVDSVFRVHVPGEEGGFVLAVESQGKPDPDKYNSWTYYLAHMYAKYRLPPFLLVVCKDKATASWAAEPIRVGRAFHTSMVVYWRNLMATYTPNFPGSNSIVEESWLEGRAKGQTEGKAQGKAEDILHILEVRGVEIPDSVRERVVGCTDLDVLGTWLDRSLSATHAEELFVGE
ncbi:hypothetical protein [Streptomyces sp. SAI-129]|uniref:hypothetical protein n=1 Tax=Streptomyces sp. SAI-129 TaxID=3377727 RepID=UPI003C7A4860